VQTVFQYAPTHTFFKNVRFSLLEIGFLEVQAFFSHQEQRVKHALTFFSFDAFHQGMQTYHCDFCDAWSLPRCLCEAIDANQSIKHLHWHAFSFRIFRLITNQAWAPNSTLNGANRARAEDGDVKRANKVEARGRWWRGT